VPANIDASEENNESHAGIIMKRRPSARHPEAHSRRQRSIQRSDYQAQARGRRAVRDSVESGRLDTVRTFPGGSQRRPRRTVAVARSHVRWHFK
jgi:hypothetical protein